MKIIIEEDGDRLDISNENFNVDNFVSIRIRRGKTESGIVCEERDLSMDVTAEELYSAAKAFYEMRTRRRKADKLL
jgi:hypothetical protein